MRCHQLLRKGCFEDFSNELSLHRFYASNPAAPNARRPR
jgi:hypothetical protein